MGSGFDGGAGVFTGSVGSLAARHSLGASSVRDVFAVGLVIRVISMSSPSSVSRFGFMQQENNLRTMLGTAFVIQSWSSIPRKRMQRLMLLCKGSLRYNLRLTVFPEGFSAQQD